MVISNQDEMPLILGPDDLLQVPGILPGFSVKVAQLFE
jgi:hypothetical protein